MSGLIKPAALYVLCLSLLSSCRDPNILAVSLLENKNKALQVRAVDWDDGFELFTQPREAGGKSRKIIESAVCRNVTVFWADERTLMINYDALEATYFNTSYGEGFDVDICRRGTNRCLLEPASAVRIKGCGM